MRVGSRIVVGVLVVGTVAGALAGCVGSALDPDSSASSSPSATAVAPTPTATAPATPVLVPDGTAEDNLPLFAHVGRKIWAGPERGSGRAYIDALVAAGFEKGAMQVTADQTTIGNPVDSIEFSVRWGDQCLVGQVGAEIGDSVAVVLPLLADGRCLVGETRPIDW